MSLVLYFICFPFCGRRIRSSAGGRWRGFVLGGLLSAGTLLAGEIVTPNKEQQVKAAFLYNFTKFVEWPDRVGDTHKPITIGILGQPLVRDELEKIVQGRKVNGRELAVMTITSLSDLPLVNVLFVGAGEESRLAGKLPALQHLGVLVVGESKSFAALDGMITFSVDGDKVRFEINQFSAEQAGLKISAQLLKLATAVRKTN